MPWARIDDDIMTNPKIMSVGAEAKLLHLFGIVHCSKNLTDGFVSEKIAPTLGRFAGIGDYDTAVVQLVEAGLWDEAEGGYNVRERGRMWNIELTEQERARLDNDIRRARKNNAPRIERINRHEVINRDNSVCHICGRRLQPHEITLDHVVPLARGGCHTYDNLRVACRSCNSRKGAR